MASDGQELNTIEKLALDLFILDTKLAETLGTNRPVKKIVMDEIAWRSLAYFVSEKCHASGYRDVGYGPIDLEHRNFHLYGIKIECGE